MHWGDKSADQILEDLKVMIKDFAEAAAESESCEQPPATRVLRRATTLTTVPAHLVVRLMCPMARAEMLVRRWSRTLARLAE